MQVRGRREDQDPGVRSGCRCCAAPEKQRIKIDTNRPISPEALRLAEEEGVDIAGIEGSGRGGRITHQDVVKALRGEGAPRSRARFPSRRTTSRSSPRRSPAVSPRCTASRCRA
ncbi:E3 binding domain-containing protein [Novosphingobium resinovorum]